MADGNDQRIQGLPQTYLPRPTPPAERGDDAADARPVLFATPFSQTDISLATGKGDRLPFSSDLRAIVGRPGIVVTDVTIPQPAAPSALPRVPTEDVTRQVRNVTGDVSHELGNARREVVDISDTLLRGRARLDAVTPAGTRAAEIVGAGNRAVIRGTPTGATDAVRDGVASVSRALGSVIPRDANYTRTLPFPVFYDDGRGTRVVVPPGSRLVARDGNLRLQSPGAFLTANGTTVRMGSLDLNIGPQSQSSVMQRFTVDSRSTSIDLQGLQTRLATDGSFLMRADSASIDLRRSQTTIRLTGAEFASTSPDAMRAGFEALAVRTPGVSVTSGPGGITTTTQGEVNRWTADAANLAIETRTSTFRANNLTMTLQRDGRTGAGNLGWTANGVTFNDGRNTFQANVAAVDFARNADGTSAFALRGRDVNLRMGDRTWTATGTSAFQINYDARGQLRSIVGEGDRVQFTDPSTNMVATGASLRASFDDQGLVTHLRGGARGFDLQHRGNTLAVRDGSLDFTRDGSTLVMRGDALSGSYTSNHGTYELGRNGRLEMRMDGNVTTLRGTAEAFSYADGRGRLQITNGQVDARFGSDGDGFRFTGDNVRYTGSTATSQLSQLTVDNAVADVRRDASGALSMGLSGRNVAMTLDGHRVTVANADHVNIRTAPDGSLANIDMLLPGRSTVTSRDGDVNIGVEGLDARYVRNATGEALRIGFDRGQVDIRSLGLVANGTDIRAGFRVDSQGRLTNAGLDVGTLDARYRDTSIRVNNQPGESLSLRTRFTDGVFRDAVLRVPNGGQLLVNQGDVTADIRRGIYGLSYDAATGTWRGRAQDFQAFGTWRDVSVATSGRNADVSLVNGALQINNITATNVRVRNGDFDVNVDMQQVDNVLARVAGISGLARGAMITLTPTADNSRITAHISTNYAGIPFSLRIDNARQLEALAMVQVNQAQFRVQDPSGQGRIRLEAGPLSASGSQIGAVVTYRPFEAMRFTDGMGLMAGGYRLGDHFEINPNGAFTVGALGRDSLFFGGLTVAPPRHVNPHQEPTSGIHQPLVPTDSWSMLLHAGIQGTDGRGVTRGVGLYGGLVDGAQVNARLQGDWRLVNTIPVPNDMTLPATAAGGVQYRHTNADNSTWTLPAGAPAAIGTAIRSPWIEEPAKVGGHATLSYQRGDLFATGSVSHTPGAGTAAMFRIGTSF
ncbi:MAG: hypothetical protein ACAI38_20005 [Myxococcota bacterium]